MVSSKAMLAFTVFVVVVGIMSVKLGVEGVRELHEEAKKAAEEVQHPENFFGGLGGIFPSPTGGTTIPGFGPSTGSPGVGSSVDFCSVPSLGCVRVQPANPGSTGASGGQGGSSTPTYPFP